MKIQKNSKLKLLLLSLIFCGFVILLFACKKTKNKWQELSPLTFYNQTFADTLNFIEPRIAHQEGTLIYSNYVLPAITYINCTFKQPIIAYLRSPQIVHTSIFRSNINFINCTFQSSVDLSEAYFEGNLGFNGCVFSKEVSFEGAKMNGFENIFVNSIVRGCANFSRIKSRGDLSFFKTRFEDNANFQSCMIEGLFQLGGCIFDQTFDLSNSKIKGVLQAHYLKADKLFDISYTKFSDKVELISSELTHGLNSSNCLYLNKLKLNNSKISSGMIDFSNTIFALGRPEMQNISLTDSVKNIWQNCLFTTFSPEQIKNP